MLKDNPDNKLDDTLVRGNTRTFIHQGLGDAVYNFLTPLMKKILTYQYFPKYNNVNLEWLNMSFKELREYLVNKNGYKRIDVGKFKNSK